VKALFLDRDGTLIVDKVYLADPAGVEVIPGSGEALLRARRLGYRLYLFTNQSGIGRGFHTLEDTHRVNRRMEELLGLPPPLFDEVCIAQEAPGAAVVYRKPSPRFILETIERNGLEPAQCWMVGDSSADAAAARAAGIRAALLRTGKVPPDSLPEVAEQKIPVFDDLAAFVRTLR
jgi:D-glycero-D-manno-heptose 1,7-bisphosphate phosphatase